MRPIDNSFRNLALLVCSVLLFCALFGQRPTVAPSTEPLSVGEYGEREGVIEVPISEWQRLNARLSAVQSAILAFDPEARDFQELKEQVSTHQNRIDQLSDDIVRLQAGITKPETPPEEDPLGVPRWSPSGAVNTFAEK